MFQSCETTRKRLSRFSSTKFLRDGKMESTKMGSVKVVKKVNLVVLFFNFIINKFHAFFLESIQVHYRSYCTISIIPISKK